MSDWQPIETAPKDGKSSGQLGVCVACKWGSRWSFHHAWRGDYGDEWVDISSDRILDPIVWMPLPSPPESE